MKRRGRALTRSTRQTGSSDSVRDRQRKALAPGKRRSRTGKIYSEYRKNRSDVKGRDTPLTRKQVRKLVSKGGVIKKKVVKRVRKISVAKTKINLTAERKRRILAQYNRNEARNYHTENAVMLARLFGTPLQRKKAMMIQEAHKKRGYILSSEQKWLRKYGHSHYSKLLTPLKKRAPLKKVSMSDKQIKKVITDYNRNLQRLSKTREPLRAARRHDLLPLAIRKKLPKLYATDGKKDKMIYLKLFSPYSRYTLYVAEFDGKDTFFGYVTGMDYDEWGYSSFKELATANRGGLPLIERDMYFSPKKFSQIKK